METNLAFRSHLQSELLKRAKKNASFSIRSFARQLKVEPSSLAQILSGKRALTDKMCIRIGTELTLTPNKIRSLMKTSDSSAPQFEKFSRVHDDVFKVISDWYYYAILELTRIDQFKGDLRWISRVLGITTGEASTAIERLKRMNYLEVRNDGKWIDCLGSVQSQGNEYTTVAFREHQKQLLTKATEALENIDYDERVQSSMILVGSKERITEAKRKILNFIEELDEFMKSGDTKDEVFALSVSLFPLSQSQVKIKSNIKNIKEVI